VIILVDKHQNLVDLCSSLLITQGHRPQKNFEYEHGEIDILCNRIYYEIKCNKSHKLRDKAIDQIQRAIRYGYVDYGYMVTYDGFFDILKPIG
jgi:hypothetical protein